MNQILTQYLDKLLSHYSDFWQMVLITFFWAAIIFFQVQLKEAWTEGGVIHKKDHPHQYHILITLESILLYVLIVGIIAYHRGLIK